MLLAAQGLCDPSIGEVGEDDVHRAIQRMGVLQIDTIHVVARSPYLVLWSRLGNYDQRLLDKLLATGRLFEYWDHAACFIPIEDFPFHRRLIIDQKRHPAIWRWHKTNSATVERVLAFVLQNGAAQSSDFERTDGEKAGWWNWKDEKIALESLHTAGELMIRERKRFQRIYALRSSVLPDWSDEGLPDCIEAIASLTGQSIRCLGVAHEKWIADYHRFSKAETAMAIQQLASKGELMEAQIEGLPGRVWVHHSQKELAERVQSEEIKATRTTLLSPFDPVVWDRTRGRELFDFDYTIECYVPGPKRKYGYFTLPILYRDRLIGRLDAKAHRAEKRFEVKALYFEPGFKLDDESIEEVGKAIKECAIWHKTPTVQVTDCSIRGGAKKIESAARRKRHEA